MKNDIIPYFDGIVISPGPGKPTEQEVASRVNERQGIDISNTECCILGLWSMCKCAFRMQSSNIWCLSGTSGTCFCSGRTGVLYSINNQY